MSVDRPSARLRQECCWTGKVGGQETSKQCMCEQTSHVSASPAGVPTVQAGAHVVPYLLLWYESFASLFLRCVPMLVLFTDHSLRPFILINQTTRCMSQHRASTSRRWLEATPAMAACTFSPSAYSTLERAAPSASTCRQWIIAKAWPPTALTDNVSCHLNTAWVLRAGNYAAQHSSDRPAKNHLSCLHRHGPTLCMLARLLASRGLPADRSSSEGTRLLASPYHWRTHGQLAFLACSAGMQHLVTDPGHHGANTTFRPSI